MRNLLEYMPHGIYLNWNTFLISLHLISDFVIFVSYFSISVFLFLLVRNQKNIPYKGILILFIIFISLCGLTHFMNIYNMFIAEYYSSGIIKALTALVSFVTVIVLAKQLPRLLKTQLMGLESHNIIAVARDIANILEESVKEKHKNIKNKSENT